MAAAIQVPRFLRRKFITWHLQPVLPKVNTSRYIRGKLSSEKDWMHGKLTNGQKNEKATDGRQGADANVPPAGLEA